MRLIKWLSCESDTRKERQTVLALAYLGARLRDCVSLNRFEITVAQIDQLSIACHEYFKVNSLFLPSSVNPTVWTLGHTHPGEFLCGFIYRPPNVKTQIDSNIVSKLEGAILNSNETWLLGDVNINLSETNSLPFLPQALSNIGLHQLISGVTRPASQTCLDHVYSTEISRIVTSGILVYGPSDHLPVFAVRLQFIKPKRSHTVIQYRDYKHLNENSLREDLQQLPFNDVILE